MTTHAATSRPTAARAARPPLSGPRRARSCGLRAGAGALGLTLLLAACGAAGGEDAGAEGALSADEVSAEHNEADLVFAQQMIPHHEQAVMMSEMAESRAASPEVRELAEEIEAAQGPEIATMRAFLEAWGAEETGGMAGMDMEGMDMGSMPGMMSDARMGELEGSDGSAFDRMFLESMIAHHEGAIEMADVEVADGVNPQAVELAEQIRTAQEAEIEVMEQLLADG